MKRLRFSCAYPFVIGMRNFSRALFQRGIGCMTDDTRHRQGNCVLNPALGIPFTVNVRRLSSSFPLHVPPLSIGLHFVSIILIISVYELPLSSRKTFPDDPSWKGSQRCGRTTAEDILWEYSFLIL